MAKKNQNFQRCIEYSMNKKPVVIEETGKQEQKALTTKSRTQSIPCTIELEIAMTRPFPHGTRITYT